MPFAQGSRTRLSYIAETTFGTTPATPTFLTVPYESHNLDFTKERVQGNDIVSDRMIRIDRHGNRAVAGDISVDLRRTNYDAFLESAFMSTWATNVLKVGTTLKSFTVEDAALDIGQFQIFKGCAVSKLAVSIKPNQMVNGTFSFVGQDAVFQSTTAATTTTAATNYAPFDAYSGTIRIANTGAALASVATITGIDFSIDNGFNQTYVVGSAITPQLEYGMAVVEGTVTAYFEDLTLINRFVNEVETALEVKVDAPGTTSAHTWLFPRVKFNGASVNVDNPQSRIITIPFVALYDTTEATNVKLTRAVP